MSALLLYFNAIDINGDGQISFIELKAALTQLGLPLADSQMSMLLNTVDADMSGQLNVQEFYALINVAKTLVPDIEARIGTFLANQTPEEEEEETNPTTPISPDPAPAPTPAPAPSPAPGPAPSTPAGADRGKMRVPTGISDRQSGYARERFQLRNIWNGSRATESTSSTIPVTPFRAVLNASDYAPSSCNPKYVYDSSVYLMFKKQSAAKHTYNTN